MELEEFERQQVQQESQRAEDLETFYNSTDYESIKDVIDYISDKNFIDRKSVLEQFKALIDLDELTVHSDKVQMEVEPIQSPVESEVINYISGFYPVEFSYEEEDLSDFLVIFEV